MAKTINGIGTTYYGYGAAVCWEPPTEESSSPAEFDAVECFVIGYLPLAPLCAYHTWDWDDAGSHCRALKIKATPDLMVRAVLRPYLVVSAIAMAILGFILFYGLIQFGNFEKASPVISVGFVLAVVVFAVSLGSLRLLGPANNRRRDIRLILGRHELGSSDPAMWLKDTLARAKPAQELFGFGTYQEAARAAIDDGKFASALLAARLAVANDEPLGASLTDEILTHPDIRDKLEQLRDQPWLRGELLGDDPLPPYLKPDNDQ